MPPHAHQDPTANRNLDETVGQFGDTERQCKAKNENDGSVEGPVHKRTRDHVDRPMPQVEPVGTLADPTQRLYAEPPSQRSTRVGSHGDQQHRDDRQDQEAALGVHEGCVFAHEHEEVQNAHKCDESHARHDDRTRAGEWSPQSAGTPERGQCCADKQTHAV